MDQETEKFLQTEMKKIIIAGGKKHDQNKVRIDLIPPEIIYAIAEILTYGAKKYSERNWEEGITWDRLFGAINRHLWAFWSGVDNDSESGLPHLHHAACGIAMLVGMYHRRPDLDNRCKMAIKLLDDFNANNFKPS